MVEFFILILCEKGRKYNRKDITISAMKCLQPEIHFTVKTLNIGTPRPATVVVLNIKQFNFTMT